MCEVALSFGGLRFRLQSPARPRVDREIAPFVTAPEGPCDVSVTYRPDGSVSSAEIDVSPAADRVTVRYHPELSYRFAALRGCLIYIPMEQVLLAHHRFFLHASLVTSPFGGLLFSGNSGAGKSTQAELWRAHRGSTVINGDRAILSREADGWRAYGSPYAGSSGYFVRRDAPVRAIVLLEQGAENRVDTVSPAEAFRRLLLQISADHSRTGDVIRLCDLVTELIDTATICRLRCTPDLRAVEALEQFLRGDDGNG